MTMPNIKRFPIVLLTVLVLALPAWSQQGDQGETRSYLFQVVLLIGSSGGTSELEGVSANVTKALDDVSQFLPFKSYRLLDTALLRSAERAEARLSGPEGQDYSLQIGCHSEPDKNRIVVRRFFLLDHGVPEVPEPPRGGSANSDDSSPAPAPRASRSRILIDSSFSLDVGETIIVGSSKLDGGSQALLVLLTAIP